MAEFEFANTWEPTPEGRRRLPVPVIWKIWGYSPRDEEVFRFHASTARRKIASAAARTSKSFAGWKDALPHVFPDWELVGGKRFPCHLQRRNKDIEGDDRRIWIVGPDYSTQKEWQYAWADLIESKLLEPILEGTGGKIEKRLNNPKQGDMEILINWGEALDGRSVRTSIMGKSSTNPKSLQGEQIDYLILSEAAEHDEKVMTKYLGTRFERACFPTTPKPQAQWLKHWIDSSNDPVFNTEAFRFTPKCNPTYDWTLYWEEHARAEFRHPECGRVLTRPYGHDCFSPDVDCWALKDPQFGEQFGGLWTYAAGRVLPFRWDDSHGMAHVIHELPDWFHEANFYVSVDWGFNDPACAGWWAVGPNGLIVLYREIYQSGLDPDVFSQMIKDRTEERIHWIVGDPKKPELARFMRRIGLPVRDVHKAQIVDRKLGHARLIQALADDANVGHPRLFLLSERGPIGMGCPAIINEWKMLHYKDSWTGDEYAASGFSGRDEGYDIARYFLLSGYEVPRKHMTIRQFMRKYGPSQQRVHDDSFTGYTPGTYGIQ